MARILGCVTAYQVSRHEHSATPPNAPTVFGYQVLFQEPAADIFPGLFDSIQSRVNERLVEFEDELHDSTAKGSAAVLIARRLEWLCARKGLESAE